MTGMDRREFLKLAGATAGVAAAQSIFPGWVFAQEGGKPVIAASAVRQPSFIAPAIVKTGDAIPMIAQEGAQIASLWLQPAAAEGKIALKISADSKSFAPESTPAPGMYDLFAEVATKDGKRIEKQPLAVRFVNEFKRDFVFGVISDVHFGDPRVRAKVPDFDTPGYLKKEIDIMNERGVEFCISCGDFCFIPPGTKTELLDYVETLAANAKFPIFSVPGNHDGYATGTPKKVNYDTFKYWYRYFGSFYYDSSYDGIELIGINTYDRPALERNIYGGKVDTMDCGAMQPEQLAWLESALKAARARNNNIIMFGHQNPTNTVIDVNGPFEVKPFTETGRLELIELMKKYDVDAFFNGHVHGIYEEKVGNTKVITAPTTGSLPFGDFPLGFLMVTVKDGKVASYETVVTARL